MKIDRMKLSTIAFAAVLTVAIVTASVCVFGGAGTDSSGEYVVTDKVYQPPKPVEISNPNMVYPERWSVVAVSADGVNTKFVTCSQRKWESITVGDKTLIVTVPVIDGGGRHLPRLVGDEDFRHYEPYDIRTKGR